MQPWQPLLDLWFGDEADDTIRATWQAPLWWGKSSKTDALLASRVGELAQAVEHFGRFPHRHDIPGRISTPEEVAFLQQPGSGF